MKKLMWIAAITALVQVPVAFAQTETPTNSQVGASAMSPSPENCGTPDEPKACPPLPRHPLKVYSGR